MFVGRKCNLHSMVVSGYSIEHFYICDSLEFYLQCSFSMRQNHLHHYKLFTIYNNNNNNNNNQMESIRLKAGRGPARVQLNKEVKHQTEAVPYPYKNWIVIYDASIISGSVSFLTH